MRTIGLTIEKDRLPAENAEEETKLPEQQNKAPKKKTPKAKKPPKEKETPEETDDPETTKESENGAE